MEELYKKLPSILMYPFLTRKTLNHIVEEQKKMFESPSVFVPVIQIVTAVGTKDQQTNMTVGFINMDGRIALCSTPISVQKKLIPISIGNNEVDHIYCDLPDVEEFVKMGELGRFSIILDVDTDLAFLVQDAIRPGKFTLVKPSESTKWGGLPVVGKMQVVPIVLMLVESMNLEKRHFKEFFKAAFLQELDLKEIFGSLQNGEGQFVLDGELS